MVWQEPNKFLVSGVDGRTRVQRILLRFKTADVANQVAGLLKEDLSVVVEPLPKPAEEIQIELQFIYSLADIIPATIRIMFGILFLVGLVIFLSNESVGEIGIFFGVLILGYLFGPALIILALMRRKMKTGLRFEPTGVVLKTNWTSISPRSIAWESATSILVKSRGAKLRIQFLSSSDAARAVQMLRERFPKLEQTNIAY